MLPFLVVLLTLGLPIAWLVAEFKARRSVRVALGIGALLLNYGLAFLLANMLNSFDYNSWYGGATKELIDATVAELDTGQQAHVSLELKRLQAEFQPTYENRAKYDTLVSETVSRLKAPALAPAASTTRATSAATR